MLSFAQFTVVKNEWNITRLLSSIEKPISTKLSDSIPVELETKLVTSLSQKLVCFSNKVEELENSLIQAVELENDIQAYADFYCDTVFANMQELRAIGDAMETETSSDYWPYPSYGEMLFGV